MTGGANGEGEGILRAYVCDGEVVFLLVERAAGLTVRGESVR